LCKASVNQPKSSVEIDDIFSKKKASSEIDDIFANKPVEKQAKAESTLSLSTEKEKKDKKPKAAGEVDDSNEVQEVVFAELAAVKASKKRTVQPKIADDDGFSDSRGKKSSKLIDQ
jgi:hypothetical protein